ncbi:MAG: NAD(P)H-binding protein [Spirosomataceae bacterium]
MKKITVFGATGMLGQPVVSALAAAGFEITALVRNPAKANLPSEIRLIEGDLSNLSAIREALEGAEGIYLSLSFEQTAKPSDFIGERDGLLNVLSVIKDYPIQRIGYLSSIIQAYEGFQWWIFDWKREAIRLIKETGIPYTLFYPSNFMETLPGRMTQNNRILLAGTPKVKNYWIAAEDYGKQVAQSFLKLTAENREYTVQGPEALTVDEGAEVYLKNCAQKGLKIIKMPLWVLKIAGIFSPQADYGYHVVKAMLEHPEPFEAQTTWDELGKPTITMAQFAQNA